jgi:murein DD-endopeptidase MepM/ murein hydrolase activator NlpD
MRPNRPSGPMRTLPLVLVILAAATLPAAAAAYPWPVKPFDRQHPIRGFFGDPRTVYAGDVDNNGISGPGSFSFHQGVDIVAPDGTPVYAIANGRIRYMGAATLNLVTTRSVTFQYFHVVAVVGEGQHVVARQTVIGYVQAPYGHVHISEIRSGHAVNPLQRGHLTPYADTTRPTVASILVENHDGVVQDPTGLCGRVQIVADAFDTPPLRVTGKFDGLPVAPALVTWQITRGSRVVVPMRVAADFRRRVPPNSHFWDVYARGSYQNDTRFGDQQFAATPGRYLFLLAPRFDTRYLRNGAYEIHVRATDVRGNTSALTKAFSVANTGAGCRGSLASAEAPAPPPDLVRHGTSG